MKSRKHAVPVFLLLTLSLLFSCGKKEEEQASADMATPLSILAPDAYKTAIERVKSKMKGAELSVTAYPAEERESVHTRMQIAYMAGEGYDVFFLDGQPVWNYAQGGYLADFYEIIEEDAGTDIDDFYTNVLKAFEYNGKLYMFPLSFGFDYIGINAKLPGEYIERFSRYETISNREVLRIYNDLRNEYAEDFKSLSLSNAEYLNEPYSAIDHALVNYIDMDNQSANINDRRFLETLGEVKQKYDEMNLFARDRYLVTIPIASRKELSAYSSAYIFLVDALYLNPVNALFSPKDPRFVHYIPIADEEGRLM
ncbi:MAG: hypothetical protein LBR83_03810, partial [Clostridiales bacterium]|nr:hypothetical protein [Clostridiales bacterium]